jgi:sigma-54 specific flagellar transcriptional regulator A
MTARPIRFRPIGRSAAMAQIHRLICQVAAFDSNVLVLGESGTGKEMVARHIHELSSRAGRAFVPVNCGAIPADLLESELFGHEKGAFTGALSARQGRFEYAEGGTMFLDEIGDMSLAMQVKLLRVLQERTFERVGSNRTIDCNVRIIAATHRDLEALIAEGRFREDLFYRLNVFPIVLPPLRDRIDDLLLLIGHLLERNARVAARIQLTPRALAALARCRWPGNVRELSNLLERLCILHPGATVDLEQLPERYRPAATAAAAKPGAESTGGASLVADALPSAGLDLRDHLNNIEIGLIRQALAEAGGTVAEAARLLKMRRTTLVEKLKKHRLDVAGAG